MKYCINCKWYQEYNNFIMNKFDHNCMINYYKREKKDPVLGDKHLYSEVADCSRKNICGECEDYKRKWYLIWVKDDKDGGKFDDNGIN